MAGSKQAADGGPWGGMDREGWVATILTVLFIAFSIGTTIKGSTHLKHESDYDTGATAWILTCTALVLFMTPGLAFFYGGMVSRKSILYTMFQCICAMALVTVFWVLMGFSLVFGESAGGVIGDPKTFLLYKGVGAEPDASLAPTIPLALFSIFHLKFCIISGPIVSGAFTERIALAPYLVYLVLFSALIYCPVAHAVWNPKGFLREWGVVDYAGGLVVETVTGYSALAGAYIFRQGQGHTTPAVNTNPHIPFIVLGTSLLWFGWFGFNAGSALSADGISVQAFLNTHIGASSCMITWLLYDKMRGRKPSVTAACVAAVCGLVSITPACGYVNTGGAFLVGIVSAIACNNACEFVKHSPLLDDQLEVWPAHGLGGTVGTIMTGLLADPGVNSGLGEGGLVYGSGTLFLKNLAAAVGVAVYATVMSFLAFKVIGLFMDLHVSSDAKTLGLDVSTHGETVVYIEDDDEEHLAKHTGTEAKAADVETPAIRY